MQIPQQVALGDRGHQQLFGVPPVTRAQERRVRGSEDRWTTPRDDDVIAVVADEPGHPAIARPLEIDAIGVGAGHQSSFDLEANGPGRSGSFRAPISHVGGRGSRANTPEPVAPCGGTLAQPPTGRRNTLTAQSAAGVHGSSDHVAYRPSDTNPTVARST